MIKSKLTIVENENENEKEEVLKNVLAKYKIKGIYNGIPGRIIKNRIKSGYTEEEALHLPYPNFRKIRNEPKGTRVSAKKVISKFWGSHVNK